MPAKVYLDLPEHEGDFRAMPASMGLRAGVKWVNAHPKNPSNHGLPSVMGLYILNDPATAWPLAVMDATWLTAVRTGAAAAVASKYLARPSARSIGFIGCGAQARTLWDAHRAVFEDLEPVTADLCWQTAERFAQTIGGRAGTVAEAAGCDIVCSSTPARSPVVSGEWITDGCHINAIGADAPGKQELDPEILRRARIVIDEWEQASHSGEVNVPLARGQLVQSDITGTLGQVVSGAIQGRVSVVETTVFDSTGLAVQDLAVAALAVQRATQVGRGVDVRFFGG